MKRFWVWLLGLNPFLAYFEKKIRLLEVQERIDASIRAEKAEERAAFLAAIQGMTQVAVEAAKATQMQAKSLNTFLDSFKVDTPLVAREWDEEADNQRYLKKHYPQAMQEMPDLEQFQLLLDKMDEL